MKSLKYILTLGLLFVVTLPSHSQWFMERNDVDEFTGEKVLITIPSEMQNEQGNRIYPFFHLERWGQTQELIIQFRASVYVPNPPHRYDDEFIFLIDGERQILKSHKTEVTIDGASVVTTKRILLSDNDLNKFQRKNNIRLRIGRQYYRLSRDGVRVFTQFKDIQSLFDGHK